MEGLARNMAVLCRQNIGFAFFLAWNYIALFGCGMAIGSFVPYNLEYIWLVSAASATVVALVLLGRIRRRPTPIAPRWGLVAAACAVVGNVSLWVSYAIIDTFWFMFAVAGAFDGAAIVLFTVVWGARLVRCNEARTEFDVVACFVVSFALYGLTLPIKLWGLVDLAVACALPCLSAWLAFRENVDDPDRQWGPLHAGMSLRGGRTAGASEAGGAGGAGGTCGAAAGPRAARLPELAMLRGALVLVGACWFLVAFFRVIDAPVAAYNRYLRYLISFALGFLVTFALFSVLIRAMRYVNVAMGYRWLLPFVVLNTAILCVGGRALEYNIAAYTVIHAGMFGMQMSFWIALAKYLRRMGGRPHVAFAGAALAQGAGILLGCAAGLVVVHAVDDHWLMGTIIAVAAAAITIIMMVGYNPSWYFTRAKHVRGSDTANPHAPAPACVRAGCAVPGQRCFLGEKPSACAGAAVRTGQEPGVSDGAHGLQDEHAAAGAGAMYDVMQLGADELRQTFGLTERETEVAALLLCGRSRPYIRDELGISLNTVHAHARSILAKCNVHSQRELIDLLPDGPAAR